MMNKILSAENLVKRFSSF